MKKETECIRISIGSINMYQYVSICINMYQHQHIPTCINNNRKELCNVPLWVQHVRFQHGRHNARARGGWVGVHGTNQQFQLTVDPFDLKTTTTNNKKERMSKGECCGKSSYSHPQPQRPQMTQQQPPPRTFFFVLADQTQTTHTITVQPKIFTKRLCGHDGVAVVHKSAHRGGVFFGVAGRKTLVGTVEKRNASLWFQDRGDFRPLFGGRVHAGGVVGASVQQDCGIVGQVF
jgi:hypothetical protein